MFTFEDQINGYIKRAQNYKDVLTDFYSKHEIEEHLESIKKAGLNYRIDGGYEEAGRVRLYMTMFDYELDSTFMSLGVISFSGNTKFIAFNHRDCLGALMGLGIERKCLGDIIVRETGFDVITNGKIDDYLLQTPLSIKRVPLQSQAKTLDELEIPELALKEQVVLVSQMRCDAIIAKTFNISRATALRLIESGQVKIGFKHISQGSVQCEEGQEVSVKGFGKFRILEILGLSKKDKIKIKIGKFV